MNRTVVIAAASVVLLAVFAALALGIVADRRPLDHEVTRSFGKAVSAAAGNAATVGVPACTKVSVDFYDCTAAVTPDARPTQVNVAYHLWLEDDGCWDTKRRTPTRQPAALGRIRARFDALRGCVGR